MTKLIYHSPSESLTTSPFDNVLVKISHGNKIKIVSPFIGIEYLNRLINLSSDWILISDIEAWISSLSRKDRVRVFDFINSNIRKIHHYPGIHAKTIINPKVAYFGSSNITKAGILNKAELGALIEEKNLVDELNQWFDELWEISESPDINEIHLYIEHINQQDYKLNLGPKISSSKALKVKSKLTEINAEPTENIKKHSLSSVDQTENIFGEIGNSICIDNIDNYIYRLILSLSFEDERPMPPKTQIESITNINEEKQDLLNDILVKKCLIFNKKDGASAKLNGVVSENGK